MSSDDRMSPSYLDIWTDIDSDDEYEREYVLTETRRRKILEFIKDLAHKDITIDDIMKGDVDLGKYVRQDQARDTQTNNKLYVDEIQLRFPNINKPAKLYDLTVPSSSSQIGNLTENHILSAIISYYQRNPIDYVNPITRDIVSYYDYVNMSDDNKRMYIQYVDPTVLTHNLLDYDQFGELDIQDYYLLRVRPVNTQYLDIIKRRGKLFDEICIGNQIGSGTYGDVYNAVIENKQDETETFVAVKLNKFSGVGLDLLAELDAWYNIPPHPFITKGIYYGRDVTDNMFTVTPLISINLDIILKNLVKYNITPKMLKLIYYQIGLAIAHIHDNNFVHLDVANRNILVSLFDDNITCAQLTDFGLSERHMRGTISKVSPFNIWDEVDKIETIRENITEYPDINMFMYTIYEAGYRMRKSDIGVQEDGVDYAQEFMDFGKTVLDQEIFDIKSTILDSDFFADVRNTVINSSNSPSSYDIGCQVSYPDLSPICNRLKIDIMDDIEYGSSDTISLRAVKVMFDRYMDLLVSFAWPRGGKSVSFLTPISYDIIWIICRYLDMYIFPREDMGINQEYYLNDDIYYNIEDLINGKRRNDDEDILFKIGGRIYPTLKVSQYVQLGRGPPDDYPYNIIDEYWKDDYMYTATDSDGNISFDLLVNNVLDYIIE